MVGRAGALAESVSDMFAAVADGLGAASGAAGLDAVGAVAGSVEPWEGSVALWVAVASGDAEDSDGVAMAAAVLSVALAAVVAAGSASCEPVPQPVKAKNALRATAGNTTWC